VSKSKPEHPHQGGSYVLQKNGALKRVEDEPAAETTAAAAPSGKPHKTEDKE
jgi:hypothetical protein